ncbi:hypothetical protein GQX73_g8777 [Xylaria multiplex]|uniref:Zn(2)-C6 fungal-type domain-containing protein n=1 Tax=Xylaria multiplex TaxID=323545 RepID=A0A7C8MNI3_9PEZI|nr:hypothetical protein GQX73_g8777 [Xylaria multiplex]
MTPLHPPDSDVADSTAGPLETQRRFECAIPNCRKVFRRKEHLTRHLKSHDTQLHDVLKRHIEFHPQYYKPKRDFVACTRCRESKTKCDEGSPCKPCSRREIQCVRASSSKANMNANSMAPELPPDVSSPSSSVHTPEDAKLREYVIQDPATVQRRLGIYFTEIHPIWPILHPSSITASESPSLLITSITMLASWLEGDLDHLGLFTSALDEITEIQLSINPPLPILQAMALCVLYATCCLATEGMALKAWKIHSNLVTACRFTNILAPQRGMWYASSHVSTRAEHQGHHEQCHRLAFAVLRLDAYLTAILDFPPLIRFQELSMPLSQSTCWVNVASEEERCRLLENEPMLRKKTSFSFRVHDLFGAPRPNALAPPWTKMDYQFRKEYFTARGDNMSPQTLLLWHMTSLKLHGPPDLWGLQERYYKLNTHPEPRPQASLLAWQNSNIARIALWHSAQIARIVSSEFALEQSTRVRINPLLIPALLMSAVVVCGYAYHTRLCPLCTGGGPIDLVNVFGAPDDCDRLARWLEEGKELVNWGLDVFVGFPVCQCRIAVLSKWFRELLARDEQADASLVSFLDELKAGMW